MPAERLRLAAYAVCLSDDRMLLARYVSPDGDRRHWTLPGGMVEHGEDPFDAVVREVAEETGYDVAVEQLLGVDSRHRHVQWGGPDGLDLHSVGVYYLARVVGGELRHETNGSTDQAAWFPVADVTDLERAVIVDVAMELERARPAHGHVGPRSVDGLRRH